MIRPACPSFDVAIVLGAAVAAGGGPSPAMARRVRRGVELVLCGAASRLLLSGGLVRKGPAEAEVMMSLALAGGVDADRIVLEASSTNTVLNAANSIAIARRYGWRTAAVVTDAYHLPRALYTFRRLGLPAVGIAAPWEGSVLRRIPSVLREALAFPGHLLRTERAVRRGGD